MLQGLTSLSYHTHVTKILRVLITHIVEWGYEGKYISLSVLNGYACWLWLKRPRLSAHEAWRLGNYKLDRLQWMDSCFMCHSNHDFIHNFQTVKYKKDVLQNCWNNYCFPIYFRTWAQVPTEARTVVSHLVRVLEAKLGSTARAVGIQAPLSFLSIFNEKLNYV